MKHLFFDLDRTLWDFDQNSKEVVEALFKHYLSDRLPSFADFYACYQSINHQLWSKMSQGLISKQAVRVVRFHQALMAFDVNDLSLAETLEQEYLAQTPLRTKLVEGAQELLNNLSGDYNLHIITNGFTEVQITKLARCGIAGYFSTVTTSDQAQAHKPQRAIFKHALALARAHPAEAWMIGDDVQNDVLAAQNMGMKAIWFNRNGMERLPKGSEDLCSVKHLNELPALLRS